MVATVGQLEFTGDRGIPWQAVGTPMAGVSNAKQALLASGLAHIVQLVPVQGKPQVLRMPIWNEEDSKLAPEIVDMPNEDTIDVPGQYIVLRTADRKPLGIVGSKYSEYQPWQAFQLMEQVIGLANAKYDTAGPLDGGRKFWISAELPDPLRIGGVDEIRRFLVIASSHDGSLQLTAFRTNIRVWCMNTLNLAMRTAPQLWKIRHSGDMDIKAEEVRRTLELSTAYDTEFERTMNDLISQEFTRPDMEKLVKKLITVKDGGEQARMALMGTFETSATVDDAWRYTKYGALQAVAEYRDWIRPRRGNTSEGAAERQLSGTWFGKDAEIKNKAMQILASS